MKKQWKFLKLNGLMDRQYKVSNHGEIVHTNGMEPLTQRSMAKRSPTNGSDYQCVYLASEGKLIRVHRIVCETFHGAAPAGQNLVNHIDEIKDNNSAQNLEWVSSSENMLAYFQNNRSRKYSDAKVSQVKKLINKGWTNDRIAKKVKMSDSNISSIKLERIHSYIEPYIV